MKDTKTKVETRASIMAELGISRVEDPKVLNEPLSPEVAEAFRNIMTAAFEQYWKEDEPNNLE